MSIKQVTEKGIFWTLRDNETGEVKRLLLINFAHNPWSERLADYFYVTTKGNMGCDCNRSLSFYCDEKDRNSPCGENRFTLLKLDTSQGGIIDNVEALNPYQFPESKAYYIVADEIDDDPGEPLTNLQEVVNRPLTAEQEASWKKRTEEHEASGTQTLFGFPVVVNESIPAYHISLGTEIEVIDYSLVKEDQDDPRQRPVFRLVPKADSNNE